MVVTESEDSNDSWTTEEFSSEFIMRYGSRCVCSLLIKLDLHLLKRPICSAFSVVDILEAAAMALQEMRNPSRVLCPVARSVTRT